MAAGPLARAKPVTADDLLGDSAAVTADDLLSDAAANPPGLRTGLAEMAGGGAGEFLGGPLGSAIGATVGGGAEDLYSGRGLSLGRSGERFVTNLVIPKALNLAFKGAGSLMGAGTRAIASRLPAVGEFAERIAPGVLRRGEQALGATGAGLEWSEEELGKLHPEEVEKRFKAFHDRLYQAVDSVTGDTPVVEGSSLKTLVPEGTKTIPGFSLEEQAAFKRMMENDSVSFSDARRVKSAFSRLSFKRQDPFAHQWATFRDAVDTDIERFLETPEGATTGPGYTAAQSSYRQGKEAIAATQLYRRALDPSGRFNAAKFASNVRRWDVADSRGGSKLVHLVGQERANDLRAMAERFGMQTEKSPTLAGRAARGIAYTAPLAGAIGAEEAYRRGEITPGRVAGTAMTLAALHPAGRAMLTPIAGQVAALATRQEAPAFIDWLKGQGFTP